jgi:hypothetical protein
MQHPQLIASTSQTIVCTAGMQVLELAIISPRRCPPDAELRIPYTDLRQVPMPLRGRTLCLSRVKMEIHDATFLVFPSYSSRYCW